ncbi:MAG: hypothetical protein IAE82_18520 [Opitutaceae bacterium]|nr:hypothetical protein [Opitutaceae bacterium]
MSQTNAPHDARTAGNVVLDSALALAAFVFFTWIARGHVPSESETIKSLVGSFTGACMAGVFWLAWQMFRVVLRGQREDAKQKR